MIILIAFDYIISLKQVCGETGRMRSVKKTSLRLEVGILTIVRVLMVVLDARPTR